MWVDPIDDEGSPDATSVIATLRLSYGHDKKFRSRLFGPPCTVAVLVSPLEDLVGVDSVLSRDSCDRRTGNKCRLYDAPLLIRRTKNPLRRTARGNLTRITHDPIVEPILQSVYTVRTRRLRLFLMILSYKCTFGVPMPFELTRRFGEGVELEGFEFINAVPFEWRLTTANSASEWQGPIRLAKLLAGAARYRHRHSASLVPPLSTWNSRSLPGKDMALNHKRSHSNPRRNREKCGALKTRLLPTSRSRGT